MTITRICNALERVAARAIGALVLAVTLLCLMAVFSRYVFNLPFAWSEQVSRIGLVWMIFLGSAVIYRQKRHIAVDLLGSLLGKERAHILQMVIEALNAVFFLVVLIFGTRLTLDNLWQTYGALGISVAWYYSAAPTAASLMLLFQIERVLRRDWSSAPSVESSF